MPRWIGLFALALAALTQASQTVASESQAESSDGRLLVFLQPQAGDEEGNGTQALILRNQSSGTEQILLTSSHHEDVRRSLAELTTPIFSLDSGYVYITATDPSPYRSAVHQINLQTGRVRYVTSGWGLSVIRTGPYRGYLLVLKHLLRSSMGGTYDPVFVVRPDGRTEFMVPGSDSEASELAVGPWLSRRGWHAW